MTPKRFECNKGSRIIIDNETKLHYIMTLDWECSLVTKLLNRFAEENEQLNSRIRYLENKIQRERASSTKQHLKWSKEAEEQIQTLKEENEQLKSEIEKLSYANEDLLSEKRNWQIMSDEYCKLSEENEQLKKENKELQDTIETICKDFEESHGMDIRNTDWFTAW